MAPWLTTARNLACFYKLPYPMQLTGHAAEAHRPLDYTHDRPYRRRSERHVEVLMCVHLVLSTLYLGDVEPARGSGRALQEFLRLQPSPDMHYHRSLSVRNWQVSAGY